MIAYKGVELLAEEEVLLGYLGLSDHDDIMWQECYS